MRRRSAERERQDAGGRDEGRDGGDDVRERRGSDV